MASERILVIGGSGYIAKKFQKLLNHDVYESLAVTRYGGVDSDNLFTDQISKPSCLHVHSYLHLESVIRQFEPTIAINFANSYHRKKWSSLNDLEANLLLPLRLGRLAKYHNFRLVQVGSYFEFTNFASSFGSYSWSKLKARAILQKKASAKNGFDLQLATLFDVYGEDDPRQKLFPTLVKHFSSKSSSKLILSSRLKEIPLVYVEDVCAGLELQIRRRDTDCSLSPEKNVQLGDLVEMFQQVYGWEGDIGWQEHGDVTIDTKELPPRLKGWHQSVPLVEGILRAKKLQED